MTKEMLINVSEGEECRIAVLADEKLEELYLERVSSSSHVGNIYKGRVTNVEASIQAAFVDFGLGRNGFLHISDLMPSYFGGKADDLQESVGRKLARRDRPPIQRCLRRGDEIVVQIIKEGIGTKGPTLSTYLSIPGRILVMMPGMGKLGISRKIEDEQERRRLREILDGLTLPDGVGFILRTAGIGKSKTEIERDLKYLTRLWDNIEKTRKSSPAPVELYAEGDLVTRTVRDVFSADIDRIIVDNKDVARRVKEFFKIAMPRSKNRVDIYTEPMPLFYKYGIEREIEQMYSRYVPLPSGGSLVIDSTEAVVAIDVNSGKFRDHTDAETTAFRTDMEAADEIPRQLKLRDLGGVIICDFIDLRFERHRRELERKLHENFKKDRAKTKVLRMSQFGIVEITRQRMRPSLKRTIYCDCPHCKGSGLVKTPESMSLDVMRQLAVAASDQRVVRIELSVSSEVGFHLQNKKRSRLAAMEKMAGKQIIVRVDPMLALDEVRIELFDQRDGLVRIQQLSAPAVFDPLHRHPNQNGRRGQDERNRGQGDFSGANNRESDRQELFEHERGRRDDNRRDRGPDDIQQGDGDNEGTASQSADTDGNDRGDSSSRQSQRDSRRRHDPRGKTDGRNSRPAAGASQRPNQKGDDRQGGRQAPHPTPAKADVQAESDEEVADAHRQDLLDDEPAQSDTRGGAPSDQSGDGGTGDEQRAASSRRRHRGRRGGRSRRDNNGAPANTDAADDPNTDANSSAKSGSDDVKAPVQDAPPSDASASPAPASEKRTLKQAASAADKPQQKSSGRTGRRQSSRARKSQTPKADAPSQGALSAQPADATGKSDDSSQGTTRSSAAPVAPPQVVVPPAQRTGSSDRHLMKDTDSQPISSNPVRRPVNFRDLDEIPDDYD